MRFVSKTSMDLKWSANRKDRKINPAELGGKGIEIAAQIFHKL